MNGAVAVLNYAQNIALLPVSLFGMSMSASELTEMATQSGASVEQAIRDRMSASLGAVAYFVVPSSAAFVLLGDVVAGAVLQTGRFDRAATVWVWAVLAGSAVGLVAGTMGRLYNSAWYALHDTRTPVRIALVRIALTAILGAGAALWLPDAAHFDRRWGVAALTASAGCAAWIEFLLLRRALDARIGPTRIRAGTMPRLWSAALVAAAAGWATRLAVAGWSPLPLGCVVFAAFGTAYFGATLIMGIPEAAGVRRRIAARLAGTAGRR
jgi:putative peptidoglycan lipid II flippase